MTSRADQATTERLAEAKHGAGIPFGTPAGWALRCVCGWSSDGPSEFSVQRAFTGHLIDVLDARAAELVSVRQTNEELREALAVARRFVAETETDAERERRDEPLSLWRGGVLKQIDAALAESPDDDPSSKHREPADTAALRDS